MPDPQLNRRRGEARQMIRDHQLPPEAYQSVDEISIQPPPYDAPPLYEQVLRLPNGGQCSTSVARRAPTNPCRPLSEEVEALHSSALDSSIGIEYSTELLGRSVDFVRLRPNTADTEDLIPAIAKAIDQAGGPPAGRHAIKAAIAAAADGMDVPPDKVGQFPTGSSFEAISGAAVSTVTRNEDPRPALLRLFRSARMTASSEELEDLIQQIKSATPANGDASEAEAPWNAAHDFFWNKMTQTETGRAQLAVTIALQTARLAAYTRKLHSELAYLGWYKMLSRPASESIESYKKGPPPPVHPLSMVWEADSIERGSFALRAAYNYEVLPLGMDINVHKGDIFKNCTSDRSGWVHGTDPLGAQGYFPYNRLGRVKSTSVHHNETKKPRSTTTDNDVTGLHKRAQDQPAANVEFECTEVVVINGREVNQCDLRQATKALHEAMDQNIEPGNGVYAQQTDLLLQDLFNGIQELHGMNEVVV